MKRKPHSWTDAMVHSELIQICAGTGVFPSHSELQKLDRNDLSCQISRRGGFVFWSKKLGYSRKQSDSDFGWAGEDECIKKLNALGLRAKKTDRKRAPFDILVNGCLRIDVKTAKFTEYGVCRGWFYRIGKYPQADIVTLFQMDTGDAYYLPWHICPTTNITISRDGGIYVRFKNNIELLRSILNQRQIEADAIRTVVLPRKHEQSDNNGCDIHAL